MRRTIVRLLPGLALALATVAGAQQPAPRPNAQRPGAGMAQRAAMFRGNPAQRILGLRTPLALTDDQVKRLETLSTAQTEALRPPRPAMLRARADLEEALQKENLDGAHAAMDRLAKLRTDAAFARLKAGFDARNVLTADQKTKLQQFTAQQRMAMRTRMRPGMGPGMMGPMGGMGGGPMGGQPGMPPRPRQGPPNELP